MKELKEYVSSIIDDVFYSDKFLTDDNYYEQVFELNNEEFKFKNYVIFITGTASQTVKRHNDYSEEPYMEVDNQWGRFSVEIYENEELILGYEYYYPEDNQKK